ncbi:MAG: molybdopterin-guanine dinucleotide biosynthesis protein B [Epsilonproteobacteria bacterium]|jgi:molybdopterin-guanine dinucleotide biosynthesis protein B|nr:molybdopterin-guanine dinucleotide biosynthesis protein B [Campylobacterota bacterium]NPA88834.1 molybdopterin-guanine dinucleotide biosynthesis protein B [Campylobacterota bacterium]
MVVVGFTGPSNSGKTTIIEKVVEKAIARGLKVGVIKHDPKNKAQLDTPGKDSWKFYNGGADVVVVSPVRTTLFFHHQIPWKELFHLFKGYDILIVEGLRTIPIPRIGVFRNRFDPTYLPHLTGIATDNSISPDQLPPHLPRLDLNNPDQILEWILTHGERWS